MKQLRIDELGIEQLPREELAKMHAWVKRGDGIAVYENQDMGHPELGDRKWASFGSEESQFPEEPPERLPDFPGRINWRYVLVGVYRPDNSEEFASSNEG